MTTIPILSADEIEARLRQIAVAPGVPSYTEGPLIAAADTIAALRRELEEARAQNDYFGNLIHEMEATARDNQREFEATLTAAERLAEEPQTADLTALEARLRKKAEYEAENDIYHWTKAEHMLEGMAADTIAALRRERDEANDATMILHADVARLGRELDDMRRERDEARIHLAEAEELVTQWHSEFTAARAEVERLTRELDGERLTRGLT